MPEHDWLALEAAAEAKDFAPIEAALGVRLTAEGLAAIQQCFDDARERDVTLATLLSVIARAGEHPDGLAWERVERRRRFLHLLVVFWRDGARDRVTVGIDASSSGKTLSGAWSSLAKWKPKLDANAELARAWARDPKQKSRVVLDVVRRSATAATAPHDGEAALRAAIVAAPDDDAPRLVYADWLLERGDLRGEFIRLQLEQHRDPSNQQRADRLAALLDSSFASLVGEPAPFAPRHFVERGFASAVRLTPAAFLKTGEHLFSQWPLQQLVLDAPKFTPRQLEQLANAPAMDRVRHLVLTQRRPRDPRLELAGLTKGTHFAALRKLELNCCGASASDWSTLVTRLRAPKLEVLRLHYGHVHPALYRALGDAKHFPLLREYREYLYDVPGPVRAGEWKAGLAALASRASLEVLELNQCEHLDDDALSPLFAKQAKAAWRDVHLVNPNATDALLRAVLASPHAKQLESLRVNNGHFTLGGVLPLLKLPRLHTLAFTSGDWPEADVARLLAAMEALPRKHPLRRINLPGAGLEKHPRFEVA